MNRGGTLYYGVQFGHCTPRATGAWASMWCFNIAALLGTITLDMGINNGDQEYREWVCWVAIFVAAAIIFADINTITTVLKWADREIYLSNWYFIGAYVFTTILAVTAALPGYQHELGQVAVQGFYMHNAVGMSFTWTA